MKHIIKFKDGDRVPDFATYLCSYPEMLGKDDIIVWHYFLVES